MHLIEREISDTKYKNKIHTAREISIGVSSSNLSLKLCFNAGKMASLAILKLVYKNQYSLF